MSASTSYGTNIAFIEELYEKFRHDPSSVSESWREFFQDYEPEFEESVDGETAPAAQEPHMASWAAQPAAAVATAPPQAAPISTRPRPSAPQPAPPVPPATAPAENATTLRGAASRI